MLLKQKSKEVMKGPRVCDSFSKSHSLAVGWFYYLKFHLQKTKSIFHSAMGAAYGTAKSGTGIAAMAVMRPELIMKSIIPVVMAGIIAIYGVVVSVLIAGELDEPPKYTLYK
jgi:ATP synthase proteolipid subunit